MDRIAVTYQLTCEPGESPEAKARDITFEQTVELPPQLVSPEIESAVVGSIESIEPLDDTRFTVVISYPGVTVGRDLPQLLNVLFGNVSLKKGVLVTSVDLSGPLLGSLPGPRFGTEGLRQLCGVTERRPLLCSALKPMGLSPRQLADLSYRFALGGLDIIKDDHGLANQETAPFRERVTLCQEAVARANQETGGNTLYFPHVACPVDELPRVIDFVRSLGCTGVLAGPFLLGLDTVRWLAETSGLAILSHPALAGAFFHEDHGIAPDVMLGRIFRWIGTDGVIYPNVGGRFSFSERVCEAINARLREPLGTLRPCFPAPGGGIDVSRVPYWAERYGPDTIFLIGAALYAQEDLVRACRQLVEAVKRS